MKTIFNNLELFERKINIVEFKELNLDTANKMNLIKEEIITLSKEMDKGNFNLIEWIDTLNNEVEEIPEVYNFDCYFLNIFTQLVLKYCSNNLGLTKK